jgi:hypothetical protein
MGVLGKTSRDNTCGFVTTTAYERLKAENAKLRDFIELLLSCPRDSGECKECRRLNGLCAVELNAVKLGIEVG